jgi:hypothetical protein
MPRRLGEFSRCQATSHTVYHAMSRERALGYVRGRFMSAGAQVMDENHASERSSQPSHAGQSGITFSSERHDPVSEIRLRTDAEGFVYHDGSVFEELDGADRKTMQDRRVVPFISSLSKDPNRRSDELHLLRAGVNPFQISSVPDYASRAKNTHARANALSFLLEHRITGAEIPSAIERILMVERGQDTITVCLGLLAMNERSAGEERFIGYLEDRSSTRFRWVILQFFKEHGTLRGVPHVAALVEQMVRKRRRYQWMNDELVDAVEYLNRFIDQSHDVIRSLNTLVKYWHNLDYQEAHWIRIRCSWIGRRTLAPVPPPDSSSHTFGESPGVWMDKSRFKTPKFDPPSKT